MSRSRVWGLGAGVGDVKSTLVLENVAVVGIYRVITVIPLNPFVRAGPFLLPTCRYLDGKSIE